MEAPLIITAAAAILIGIGIAVGICIEHDSFKADCDHMGRTRIGAVVYQCSPVGKEENS